MFNETPKILMPDAYMGLVDLKSQPSRSKLVPSVQYYGLTRRPAAGYASAIYGEKRRTNANLPNCKLSYGVITEDTTLVSTSLYAELIRLSDK